MFFLPNKYLDRLLVYASMSEFAKKDYIFTTGSSGWKSVRYQKVDLLMVNSTTHGLWPKVVALQRIETGGQ